MVMETVGKIEIFFIIHSAQVLVFFSSSSPRFSSVPTKITSRVSFLSSSSPYFFLLANAFRLCTIQQQQQQQRLTNKRSENIYVFTSKHLQPEQGELYVFFFIIASWKLLFFPLDYVLPLDEDKVGKKTSSFTRSSILKKRSLTPHLISTSCLAD